MNMWQLDWSKLAEVLTYNAKQPMIFSSGLFLFLFLGFSLIYMLLQKKDTARILFVTLFSYYFYYKSSGFYFFLLGVVTVTDFLLAGRMANTETQWKRRVLLLASPGNKFRIALLFQVHQFLLSDTGSFVEWEIPAVGYFLAGGNIVLHFPVFKLYHRCLPS